MATKQELLDELSIKTKEIASESTNTLHNGILNNLASDQDFTQKVLELNYLGAFRLYEKLVNLSK